MINPNEITDFNRTQSQLEEFFMFAVIVAGKTAAVQAIKLEDFLKSAWIRSMTPFEYLRHLKEQSLLEPMLREAKLGQYKRITKTFEYAIEIPDLKTIKLNELQRIPGIGPKTARFFLLHSRPDQQYAVLDTHILAWMRENMVHLDMVPVNTPQAASRYAKLEKEFIAEAKRRKTSLDQLDLEIWKGRARQLDR